MVASNFQFKVYAFLLIGLVWMLPRGTKHFVFVLKYRFLREHFGCWTNTNTWAIFKTRGERKLCRKMIRQAKAICPFSPLCMETTKALNWVELGFPVFAEQKSWGLSLAWWPERKGILHDRMHLLIRPAWGALGAMGLLLAPPLVVKLCTCEQVEDQSRFLGQLA